VESNDQLGDLAASFNDMTASIVDLMQQAAEKKRLEEEMRLARDIQKSLLPDGPVSFPGLSISAHCSPAREVGGDYYDFFPLDRDRLGLLIADVSGKGVSAGLYMAELKGLVLSLSRTHQSPRDLLITANQIISEHLSTRSFITVTYAVIDVEAGVMTYARAGHTPVIHLPARRNGRPRCDVLIPDGLVLGLRIDTGELFESLLVEARLKLEEGDLLMFYTDGMSEAMNEAQDCYGEERLTALLEENADLPLAELRDRILDDVYSFVGAAAPHDDMTMILVGVEKLGQRRPSSPDAEVVL
jgi:phosphoserine phosphatase RsbU/P